MGKIIYVNMYIPSENGESTLFLAGEEVPDELAKLVRAPGVWDKPGESEQSKTDLSPADARLAELTALKKGDLVNLAKSTGLELKGDETKDEVIQLITARESN